MQKLSLAGIPLFATLFFTFIPGQAFGQDPGQAGGAQLGSAGQASADSPAASPGILYDERKRLLERIKEAKAEGIGVSGYHGAFASLEQSVKGGEPADRLKSRLDSLHKSLDDQLKRSKLLKTQRPIPPQGSQITGSGSPSEQGKKGGLDIAKITEKIKGAAQPESNPQLDAIKGRLDSLPEGLRDRIMNSDKAKELIKQHGL